MEEEADGMGREWRAGRGIKVNWLGLLVAELLLGVVGHPEIEKASNEANREMGRGRKRDWGLLLPMS